MDIITKAKEFASHAHRNHFHSDEAKTPYVAHLGEVAELVKESGGNDEEIAAAWLHDTVEDTEATIEEIRKEFGDGVGDIVEGVTDLPEWTELPLAERKAKQAERVAGESPSIKRVKLADQTANVRLMGTYTLNFGIDIHLIYVDSAKQIAEVCKGVSPYLDDLFQERYAEARKNLELKK